MTSNDIDTNSEQQLWKQVLRLVHHCQVDELEQLDSCLEQASWLLTHVDMQGDTLLHHATRANHLHVIDWCLQHGAPVNIANRRGRQPLHEAVGHLDSMRHLLDNDASVDGMKRGDWTPLHLTALKGDLPGLKLLLEHGADPHLTIRDGRTVLHLAATTDESMSLHLVRVVPSLITCASSNGRLPVHMAAQAGYQQALDAMLAVAPDTLEYRDHAGTTPWLAAVIGGHTELVTHLTATTNRSIQHTTDSNGRNALHLAAMIGHVPMVKLAVEQWHLSPLQQDTWDYWTPLHYAVKENNMEIVKYLWHTLKEESPSTVLALKDKQGRTIIDLARQWKHDDIVAWLTSL